MNLAIVSAFYIALIACAGNAIPLVPSDNSHYVEGTSRYIWMSDDGGRTHLVDLQEQTNAALLTDRDETGNQYWLLTRSNPYNPQKIIEGDVTSIEISNYVASKPLKIVVHGWYGSLTSDLNIAITSALLAAGDFNVIVVDWSVIADASYLTAAANTPRVGQAIGAFIVWLVNSTGVNWNNVHLIGFSLGAHAVGSAGRVASGRPRRVTGLDPAGPGWHINSNRISVDAGRYVEIIHTDVAAMGLILTTGHVSFFPNGGRRQPGCDTNQCSHSRAWELFASSVRTNHFIGRQCSDLSEALNITCSGSAARMGNSFLNKDGNGIYGLRTGSSWPF